MNNNQGFTLLEALLAIAVLALFFSISIPVSYELYKGYKTSLEAQEVMVFVSELKRNSFLHGEEIEITSAGGCLIVNGVKKEFKGLYISVKDPIKLFKNGTTNGGQIVIAAGTENYVLEVVSPFSNLSLRRIHAEKK